MKSSKADADGIVLEALLDDVLTAHVLNAAIDQALETLCAEPQRQAADNFDAQLANVEQECDRLIAAIAAGGQIPGLVAALQDREARRGSLIAARSQVAAQRRLRASEARAVRAELVDLARGWRHVLADDPAHARPIVSKLLAGRVTFTPMPDQKLGYWEMQGQGTLIGLFSGTLVSRGLASPPGIAERCTVEILGKVAA